MKFVKAKDAYLIPGQMYRITTNSGGELDRDNNLRPGKENRLTSMKFVRKQDRAAQIRASGGEPMSEYPPEVVFSFEDDFGENERAFNENTLYVEMSSDFGSQSSSYPSQGGKHRRGKKTARRFTNSSRVRRRSKTRKSRRATGGGR